jgi:predicted  nucleic acid-binding Zn-ribbon protein
MINQLQALNQSSESIINDYRQQLEIMRRKIGSINSKLMQANDQLAEAEAMNSLLNEVIKLKDNQITEIEVSLNGELSKLFKANQRIAELEALQSSKAVSYEDAEAQIARQESFKNED